MDRKEYQKKYHAKHHARLRPRKTLWERAKRDRERLKKLRKSWVADGRLLRNIK